MSVKLREPETLEQSRELAARYPVFRIEAT